MKSEISQWLSGILSEMFVFVFMLVFALVFLLIMFLFLTSFVRSRLSTMSSLMIIVPVEMNGSADFRTQIAACCPNCLSTYDKSIPSDVRIALRI